MTERDLALVDAQVHQLEEELALARSSLSSLTTELATFQRTSRATDDLFTDLGFHVLEVGDRVSSLEFDVDRLRRCVNDYMDTIGSWSSNVFSFYNYFYCR